MLNKSAYFKINKQRILFKSCHFFTQFSYILNYFDRVLSNLDKRLQFFIFIRNALKTYCSTLIPPIDFFDTYKFSKRKVSHTSLSFFFLLYSFQFPGMMKINLNNNTL